MLVLLIWIRGLGNKQLKIRVCVKQAGVIKIIDINKVYICLYWIRLSLNILGKLVESTLEFYVDSICHYCCSWCGFAYCQVFFNMYIVFYYLCIRMYEYLLPVDKLSLLINDKLFLINSQEIISICVQLSEEKK